MSNGEKKQEDMETSNEDGHPQAQQAGGSAPLWFTSYMDMHVNNQFEALSFDSSRIDAKLGGLAEKVNSNGTKLETLEKRIWQLESGQQPTDHLNTFQLPSSSSAASPWNDQARSDLNDRNRKCYDRARRSVKIFPIAGSNEAELSINLVDFMSNVLGLNRQIANGGAFESIRRVGNTSWCSQPFL